MEFGGNEGTQLKMHSQKSIKYKENTHKFKNS